MAEDNLGITCLILSQLPCDAPCGEGDSVDALREEGLMGKAHRRSPAGEDTTWDGVLVGADSSMREFIILLEK
jgi:hypothetical protein